MSDSYVAVATIGAALVTGLISVVNLTVSKEHKISELRQVWIDEIRTDLASLLSEHGHVLNSFTCERNLGPVDYWQFYSKHIVSMQKINELYHRIKMRLNPKEHEVIIALLDDLDNSIVKLERLNDLNQMIYLFKQLNYHSQCLLKNEWERVKEGEQGFKNLKKLGFSLIIVSLVGAVYIS